MHTHFNITIYHVYELSYGCSEVIKYGQDYSGHLAHKKAYLSIQSLFSNNLQNKTMLILKIPFNPINLIF